MIISCGFLIESDNKVLLCHATNGFKKFKDRPKDYRWGIPKGKQEDDEYFLESALRELKEETDLDLLDTTAKVSKNFMSVKYKSMNKTLKVFKVVDSSGSLLKFPFRCNSYFEWKGKSLPEIDSYIWVDYETAELLCIKGQKDIFRNVFQWEF